MTVGGKATSGDTVTVITHNPLLPGGQESVGYTVGASDTLVDVAAGLVSSMNSNSDLQTLGVTAKNSCTADLAFAQSFSGNGNLPSGESLAKVSVTDAVPTIKTHMNSLSITASTSAALTWDANGNMTSDGTNSYKWDAENRLIEIVYQGIGNFSQITFNPNGEWTLIKETSNNVLVSTTQFIWAQNLIREERDSSGAVIKQLFGGGEKVASTKYFYSRDHLTSVRCMTDNSGVAQLQQTFDCYGRGTKIKGTLDSTYQFAGYYSHLRSGLNLTRTRAYNALFGRWISRDIIAELGGVNLYAYVGNIPTIFFDPLGMGWVLLPIVKGDHISWCWHFDSNLPSSMPPEPTSGPGPDGQGPVLTPQEASDLQQLRTPLPPAENPFPLPMSPESVYNDNDGSIPPDLPPPGGDPNNPTNPNDYALPKYEKFCPCPPGYTGPKGGGNHLKL